MSPLCVYSVCDPRTNKPQFVGIKNGSQIIVEELYTNTNRSVRAIYETRAKIGQIIAKAAHKRPVLISDFKDCIEWFQIPLSAYQYDIYDLHLGHPITNPEMIPAVLERMSQQQPRPYQRLISNAAVVYADLERHGLLINYGLHWPKWQLKTYSGRATTTGCNIQGWHHPDPIRPNGTSERNVIIHFDWISADIRVASLLSGDERLQESFAKSDPYTVLMKAINIGSKSKLSRKESKEYLLKSINSMDYASTALASIYPDLGRWIRRCKDKMHEPRGYLETIMGRRFRLREAIERSLKGRKKKPELMVLNGVMQGSVVHAMQATLRRVWEVLPRSIIAEIHDCLLISSGPSPAEIRATIKTIVPIMMHPFAGLLDDNPAFPVKISIAKRWKKEQAFEIHRESGVTRVKKKQAPKTAADSET